MTPDESAAIVKLARDILAGREPHMSAQAQCVALAHLVVETADAAAAQKAPMPRRMVPRYDGWHGADPYPEGDGP